MNIEIEVIIGYLPIILSLIVMEGLLSIDNAMIIAAMVDHLPERQKRMALFAGLAGAYFFRGLMIVFAALLMEIEWLKILGALYLIYLMVDHLGRKYHASESHGTNLRQYGFWMTVLMVELTDLAFSIDNVVAAVALSSQLWVVITGVFIGIAVMRLMSGYFINLMNTMPILKSIAYILVGFVGIQLIAQEITHYHLPAAGKLAFISAVIAFGYYYERHEFLRTYCRPTFRCCGLIMAILLGLVPQKSPVPVEAEVEVDIQ